VISILFKYCNGAVIRSVQRVAGTHQLVCTHHFQMASTSYARVEDANGNRTPGPSNRHMLIDIIDENGDETEELLAESRDRVADIPSASFYRRRKRVTSNSCLLNHNQKCPHVSYNEVVSTAIQSVAHYCSVCMCVRVVIFVASCTMFIL
jgi:hypothetical protein